MKDTITDLWNGNIAPCERCGLHDPEADHLIGLMERHRTSLCQGLTVAQKETLQKYIDCSNEYLVRMMELAFDDGFSVAAKLTAEALL